MHRYFHLQAFELLSIMYFSDCKAKGQSDSILVELADILDRHFQTSGFHVILDKTRDKVNKGFLNDENLFINYTDLPLEYSNLEMLNLHDRLILYTCISAFILRLKLSPEFFSLSERILEIDNTLTATIKEILSGVKDPKVSGENALLYLEPDLKSGDTLDGNWIKNNQPRETAVKGVYYLENMPVSLQALFIHELKVFFIFCGEKETELTKNNEVNLCGWEYLEPGDTIEINGEKVFDYYDLKRKYLISKDIENLTFRADKVSYSFGPGKGLKQLDFRIDAGTLVGILGREGTGKSTILELLAGESLSPTGDILINDYSYRKELYHLKGMIGYVPEDDMLFQELSVYDNLLYSARLYLGNLKEHEIKEKVKDLLIELDLWNIADMIVGSYQDKFLQPGQRRMLNIALELIRDPQILIVDNAVSSLSLSDSSRIIKVLSAFTFKGRIVITSITQTDNRIFQFFERLLILGEGGFPILIEKTGNALNLLTSALGLRNKLMIQPGPNDILELLDQPAAEKGKVPVKRYKSSAELYDHFSKTIMKDESYVPVRKRLPKNLLQPPTLDRQYFILNLRNFKTKLSRTRELLVTIFSAPVLAILLSVVLRGNFKEAYFFNTNSNIPVFFFLSFLVAYFLGLILSAREVFLEQKIIQKQTYLNISKFSYVNSKITYLFIIALVQSFLFVAISHLILQIRGMLWMHWLIYFSCQASGLLTGLILSESHRSLENIYSRTLPVLILLQLLFGGGLINLDAFSGERKYTPLISDLMVTRWAHEAMLVHQFRNNKYMKHQYSFDRDYSTGYIHTFHRIPELKAQLEACNETVRMQPDTLNQLLESIRIQLNRYPRYFDLFPYENLDHLNKDDFNETIATDLSEYLEYINLYFISLFESSADQKSSYESMISDSLGASYLSELKEKYTNEAIEGEVTNSNSKTVLETSAKPAVQRIDQIYQYPEANYGRAQFYVPYKSVNGQLIDTVEFDVSIIWLFNLLLYVILLSNLISRIRR
jgi:ABC transport system ATP-binding/permease protein